VYVCVRHPLNSAGTVGSTRCPSPKLHASLLASRSAVSMHDQYMMVVRSCRSRTTAADDVCPPSFPNQLMQEVDWTRPTAFVLGNERQGVSDTAVQLADATAVIPMAGEWTVGGSSRRGGGGGCRGSRGRDGGGVRSCIGTFFCCKTKL
jgi:hypothetical protein